MVAQNCLVQTLIGFGGIRYCETRVLDCQVRVEGKLKKTHVVDHAAKCLEGKTIKFVKKLLKVIKKRSKSGLQSIVEHWLYYGTRVENVVNVKNGRSVLTVYC